MSYTLTTATTKVRELINESSADFWSDTEIQGWIQDGTLDLSSKLLTYEASFTDTLANGTYILTEFDGDLDPDDLVRIKFMYYDDETDQYPMQRIKPNQAWENLQVQSGRPRYFFESLDAVWIFPIPGAEAATNYIKGIANWKTNDITKIRDTHQPLVFLYAAAFAKMKERQWGQANNFLEMYNKFVSFERKDKYDKGSDNTEEFQSP